MERIVLEVDDRIAKAWRQASSEKRRDINQQINIRMEKELLANDKESFREYLNQLRNTMAERGLTQEKLDEILYEDV